MTVQVFQSREFTTRVVGRDKLCCLSGKQVFPGVEPGGLFQAAHVYPTAWRESVWLSLLLASHLVLIDIHFSGIVGEKRVQRYCNRRFRLWYYELLLEWAYDDRRISPLFLLLPHNRRSWGAKLLFMHLAQNVQYRPNFCMSSGRFPNNRL